MGINQNQNKRFHVADNSFFVGKVGICTQPSNVQNRNLEVRGEIGCNKLLIVHSSNSNNAVALSVWVDNNTTKAFLVSNSVSDTDTFVIQGNGDVGIGTYNISGYKLAVNGKIKTQEVVVETTGWHDYVFDNDYKLLKLSEVEQFIKENKHLPEIPSAKEVEENGIKIGDMQGKLLQKIEELTLYAIEQQKQIEELKKNIKEINVHYSLITILLETISLPVVIAKI